MSCYNNIVCSAQLRMWTRDRVRAHTQVPNYAACDMARHGVLAATLVQRCPCIRPMTHAPETGATNRLPFSDVRFSFRVHLE